MRRQQSDTVSPLSASNTAASLTSPQNGSLHVRDVASSATLASGDETHPRSSVDSRDRPLRNPKRLSKRESALGAERRSLSDRSAPSDYSHESDGEGAFAFDDPSSQPNQPYLGDPRLGLPLPSQSASNMDDLTEAVNHAMNDLSFGSADDTLSAEDEFSTPLPPQPKTQDDDRPRLQASVPSARSLASITGLNQSTGQDASRSSPITSPAVRTPQTPRANAGFASASASYLPSVISSQSLATPPLGSPVQQRPAQAPPATQHAVPTLPQRLDVYGRTLPMPKAFISSNIIVDKKRNSSWERARTYAQFTNELLHLDTNLSLWMEVVQRPAMRQQNNRTNQSKQNEDWLTQGTLPRSTHVRGEGSYADSVRSDMTFPMRGDGAKAKELVSVMPTMPESPVRAPANLPYPGVVPLQQTRSNSTQSFASLSSTTLPTSTSATESLSTSRSGGGNRFFGGLGRKTSKRTQPSAPTSTSSVSSPLTSAAVAVGGSRAYLANSRNNRTSSPSLGPTGSLSSARPSTDTLKRATRATVNRQVRQLALYE